MTIINNIAVKRRRFDVLLTNTNVITFSTVAIFLPYVLAAIVLISIAIYLITNKQTKQVIFLRNDTKLLKVFFAYILIIPFFCYNLIGFAVGVVVILAFVLGLYMRSIMNSELYERILTLICTLSLTSAGYAIIEKISRFLEGGRDHRISAVFFHPNYFGTIAGTVVIICAYKVLTKQGNQWFYYFVAFMNIISMYLSKSMFVWIEVFIGVAVLLVVLKRHRLLALWLFTAALGAFLIFFVDFDIIPRLSDVEVTVRLRKQIWALTIEQIKQTPIFGHGFYSFMHLFNRSYRNQVIPHAHNIILDLILNYGLIGAGLLTWYIVRYYKAVVAKCFKEKKIMISALILAVTAAAFVHGMTDITLLWFQTLPLFMFILSGIGAYENSKRSKQFRKIF